MTRSAAELAIERDGPECLWCGNEVWPGEESVEHLCPRSRGGNADPENAGLACKACNRGRRSRSAVAYAAEKAEAGHSPRLELIESMLRGLAGSGRRRHREYAERELRHLGSAWERARRAMPPS